MFDHLTGRVSVLHFQATSGTHYRPRRVGEGVEEVEILVGGRGRFNRGDGAVLGAGGMVWYGPGEWVEVWADADDPYRCVVLRWGVASPPAVRPPEVGEWPDVGECVRFCRTALALSDRGLSDAPHFALCHYARCFWEATESARRQRERACAGPLDRALELIENRYADPLDVERIAGEVRVSPSHLFLLFRRQLGVSPAQYLNQCRIRHARRLLQGTSMSIKEVGAAVGLRSPRNFCKRFRRHTGMTATEYRASFGQGPTGSPPQR